MTHGLQAHVVARVSQSALAVQGVVRLPRLLKAFCHKGDSPCHEALLVTRRVVHVIGASCHSVKRTSGHKGGSAYHRPLLAQGG